MGLLILGIGLEVLLILAFVGGCLLEENEELKAELAAARERVAELEESEDDEIR